MNEPIIHVQNVSKRFEKLLALDRLSFDVEEASCFALLGPNGAGKTTMMKMIYGKCRRDENAESSILVFGCDPDKNALDIKACSGIVPQEDNLDVELDVKRNLDIYANFYHIPKKEADARIQRLLEFMELTDKIRAKIRELSGGMKRRLLIVRALLNHPRLLILDEPTTGLDPQVRHLIWNKIRQLKKEGTTILLTTHYMEEAFVLADTILILHEGKKIMEGNPRKLLDDHMEDYVLEVLEKEAADAIEASDARRPLRKEDAFDVQLLYSDDLDDLKKISGRMHPGSHFLRQTNLEDLFMKMTGRKLHDQQ
jgi:lipooligosaccharide transport system ATP-binding protein